jgi:hypothetical protein
MVQGSNSRGSSALDTTTAGITAAAASVSRRNSTQPAVVDAPAHLLCSALQRAQSSGASTAAATSLAAVSRRNSAQAAVVEAPGFLLCSALQRVESSGSSGAAGAAAATSASAAATSDSTGTGTTAGTTAAAAVRVSNSSTVHVVIGDAPFPQYSADAGWLAACPNATATALRRHRVERRAYYTAVQLKHTVITIDM